MHNYYKYKKYKRKYNIQKAGSYISSTGYVPTGVYNSTRNIGLEHEGGKADSDNLYKRTSDHDSIIEDFKNEHKQCMELKAVYPPVGRIVAIGDLHGDFNAMFKALKIAKVIDNKGHWNGKNTHVVQVGDILDCNRGGEKVCGTGAEEIEILDFLFKLNKQAMKTGGRVINILGNHELMNVIGDFRYASSQHTEAMGGIQKRGELFRPGGDIAIKMACNMQPVVKIGKYIFVHGAILPRHLDSIPLTISNNAKLQHLTDLVKKLLLGKLTDAEFQTKYPNEYQIVSPKGEMFWDRSLSKPNGEFAQLTACNNTNSLLHKLGADDGAIIMGHTPQSEITSDCQGKLWKIDVAMSEGFGQGDNIQVLEILKNGKTINILK